MPRARLRRWPDIKPFNYTIYRKWRKRALTRFPKPDWRGMTIPQTGSVREEA